MSRCSLLNCMFLHHIPGHGKNGDAVQSQSRDVLQEGKTKSEERDEEEAEPDETGRPRKKRRTRSQDRQDAIDLIGLKTAASDGSLKSHDLDRTARAGRTPLSKTRGEARESFSSPILPKTETEKNPTADVQNKKKEAKTAVAAQWTKESLPAEGAIKESLNPRMIPNPPASHAVRFKLISMLHETITRLNEEIKRLNDPSDSSIIMSHQQVISYALNIEEKYARNNPPVYTNVVLAHLQRLRKISTDEWRRERNTKIALGISLRNPLEIKAPPKQIITGLASADEIAFLPRLLAPQTDLVNHGYVSSAPTEEEIESARRGVEAARNWEICDRCSTRFQVFPGRRTEDGALTSGGQCSYHPAKPRRHAGGEMKHPCCSQSAGESVGCTAMDSHVFKVSDAKRLALVMPYMETPENPSLRTKRAVSFDCEMGYTTYGMELIRLTATSWPSGKELVDVLVRPLGEVLDLNSRFSGVWPEDFASAIPYPATAAGNTGTVSSATVPAPLRMVKSPAEARALLFAHLTPTTPLIGHALENDLNVTRIIHPCIVDTVLLFPHYSGLPMRNGLRMLVKQCLDRDIQAGGDRGHDSKEDARAAGDLVKFKVQEQWKLLTKAGWTVKAGKFLPPTTSAEEP